MSSAATSSPSPRYSPPVIIHFSSLTNFKLAKGAMHSLLSPFATNGSSSPQPPYPGRLPEVIILPKPAGPRRVLTALHTAATKPAVDPFFTPIATSPMSPGLALYVPRSPAIPRSSPARSPLADSSSHTSSGSASGSGFDVGTAGGVSPSKLNEGMDYFSEAAVKLGTSPSSGLVIQSPDGQPAGIFFHPRLRGVQRGSSTSVGLDRGEGSSNAGFAAFGPPPSIVRREGSGQGTPLVKDSREGMRSREGSRDGRPASPVPSQPRRSSSRPAPPPAPKTPNMTVDVSVTAPTPPVAAVGLDGEVHRKRTSVGGRSPTMPVVGLGIAGAQVVDEPGPMSPTALRKVSPIDALRKATPPASPMPTGGVGFVRRRGSGMKSPVDGTSTQAEGTPPPSVGGSVPRKRATKKPDSGIVPPINVLVVEDNPINQTILTTFMRRKKIKFDVAKNGEEAVSKWKSGQFHLILMDIQMPVMDGITATTEIRRLERVNAVAGYPTTPSASSESSHPRTPDTPLTASASASASPYRSSVIIVALTASSLQSDRVAALAAGCNDFLTKPVSLDWLNSKIIEWGSIKALQMYADIKPETARGFAKGMAGQAQNVARRLRVPEGRATPSPPAADVQVAAATRERQPSAGSRERERERQSSAGAREWERTKEGEKDKEGPATPVGAVFGTQVLRHAQSPGRRDMSAAQEAAQALASGAPLLLRTSSNSRTQSPAGGTLESTPKVIGQASAPMRSLAAMKEPEAESTAHEAFEAKELEPAVAESSPEPASKPAPEPIPELAPGDAVDSDPVPVDETEAAPEAAVVTEAAPAEDSEVAHEDGSELGDTEGTPLVEGDHEPVPGPVG